MGFKRLITPIAGAVLVVGVLAWSGRAFAHCDTMDGPVVKAAQKALETGDPNPVLIWVQKQDEADIRRAFDHARAVRKLGPEAKALADRYFFETLVRVHRAGEGVAYTGLKPAGADLGPAIPAVDQAIESGKAEALVKLIGDAVHSGLNDRFSAALAAKGFRKDNLEAGREYVMRYVTFMHYAEGLYQAAARPAGHTETESGTAHAHEH